MLYSLIARSTEILEAMHCCFCDRSSRWGPSKTSKTPKKQREVDPLRSDPSKWKFCGTNETTNHENFASRTRHRTLLACVDIFLAPTRKSKLIRSQPKEYAQPIWPKNARISNNFKYNNWKWLKMFWSERWYSLFRIVDVSLVDQIGWKISSMMSS